MRKTILFGNGKRSERPHCAGSAEVVCRHATTHQNSEHLVLTRPADFLFHAEMGSPVVGRLNL
jgi:hypothetical protein